METAIADRPAQIQAAAIGYSRHLLATFRRKIDVFGTVVNDAP